MPSSQRFALITGAGSGLGRALALRLARDGWHVGLADRDLDAAGETKALLGDASGSGEPLPLDVNEVVAWQRIDAHIGARWPALDLLVNNAGVCASGEVGATPVADWDWVLGTNLRGVMLGCHTLVDRLKANPRRSHLLNVSSLAGLLAAPRMSAYCASKAAVVALSETLYIELRPHNVGVSVICPWFIQTNLLESGRFERPSHREFAASKMKSARTTPERFADLAVRGVFRNKFLITVGWKSSLAVQFKSTFRQTYLNLAARLAARDAAVESEPGPPVSEQATDLKPAPDVAPTTAPEPAASATPRPPACGDEAA
ncbi:MAG: SDR family NAD(P)-dependent oxidoreductase [Planctomyces sp.]|nr:SDR family NAD(P)-dependent oxidoreductase [Planctomyces sp.]